MLTCNASRQQSAYIFSLTFVWKGFSVVSGTIIGRGSRTPIGTSLPVLIS